MNHKTTPVQKINRTQAQADLVAAISEEGAGFCHPDRMPQIFDQYMMEPGNERRWFPRWSPEFEAAFKIWARKEFSRLMEEAL